jgi:hypothetical protein
VAVRLIDDATRGKRLRAGFATREQPAQELDPRRPRLDGRREAEGGFADSEGVFEYRVVERTDEQVFDLGGWPWEEALMDVEDTQG